MIKIKIGKSRIVLKWHLKLIATSEILLLTVIYLLSNAPRVEHSLTK